MCVYWGLNICDDAITGFFFDDKQETGCFIQIWVRTHDDVETTCYIWRKKRAIQFLESGKKIETKS